MWPRSSRSTTRGSGECSIIMSRRPSTGSICPRSRRSRRTRRRRAGGHDYISLFVDMARRKVVYVTEGKDAATVDAFAAFLEAHGGNRANITDASIDMGAAFIAGVKANFPNAKITFDKFHVIKLV